MKPRIKRAMLPRKGAYSVYVNEKCLPYESLHHFTVQEQFQCALWNPSQYVALLTLQQDQLGELARLATGSVFPADHDGRLYCLTKEGLVPELLPFYQCASPQQYQWAKEEALLLTKLRTETDRCCQKEQKPRGLIREDSHFLPREFERWIYYDVDMRFSLPFVIRVPRNSDGQSLPLLIFLHGAGGGGRSCVKPVTASFSMQWALARAGKRGECILLIPSLPTPYQWHTKNYDDNGVHGFPGIWDRLWALLLERYPIEQKQVYLTGISAGGQGCWNQLYLHPDRYAAAIPLMAGDFTRMTKPLHELLKRLFGRDTAQTTTSFPSPPPTAWWRACAMPAGKCCAIPDGSVLGMQCFALFIYMSHGWNGCFRRKRRISL